MRTSESLQEISAALVAASEDIKNLYPGAQGYGYNYIPLEAVIDHLRQVLPKQRLSYIQMPTGGGADTIGLVTRIIHESGEWIETEALFPMTDMKGVNRSQAAGAALTYFRRYALCAAFGITGDKDVDMHGDEAPHKDPLKGVALIEACQTMDDLKKVFAQVWRNYGPDKILIDAKETMKEKLS
jgi:hypothetical protein